MGYAQLDDGYDEDDKIIDALHTEPAAIGFHALAIARCNRRKSDGRIKRRVIDQWLRATPYSSQQKQRVLNVLLELHLFDVDPEDGDYYLVHNFLKWNRSAAQRDALAAAGRKGGQAKALAKAKPGPEPPPSQGFSQGQSEGHSPGSSPLTTTEAATAGNVNSNAELRSAVVEIFAYWQEQCGHPQAQLADPRRRLIEARLKDRKRHHSGDLHLAILDCRRAVDGAALAPYVDERGKRHDGIELIFRSVAKLEDFIGRKAAASNVVAIGQRPAVARMDSWKAGYGGEAS